MKLTILTYNTLFAGRDGVDSRRADMQIDLLNSVRPDIFLMQEAKGFDAGGGALLHDLEARIGLRGFLALAPRTGQNVAIFIRDGLRPLSFDDDSANFHHALATLKVALPGSQRPLSLISAHLSPAGASIRRHEAAYLAIQASADNLALLTGDFNSASPHDPEPEGFDVLAAHHRARYLADDLKTADRSVLAHLEAGGWVDVGYALGQNGTPTVPTAAFTRTEFATMRCDYVLASASLAAGAKSYSVIRTPQTDAASDHYPIVATFEVAE